MSKFLKFSIPLLLVLLAAGWFLLKDRPIAGVPGWPPSIQRNSNGLGMLNVKDTESGTTLFWYHSALMRTRSG